MIPQTVEVPPQNRFKNETLDAFLRGALPEYGGGLSVRQFPGGFSNPTYALDTLDRYGRPRQYVLRKRPGASLPSSAHRVDREFRVLSALHGSGVPVPQARAFCEDPAVLGSMFFVMERVPGRLFSDPTLPGCTPAERAAIYDDLAATLARLHALDFAALGLADYGKPGDYLQRQVDLWTRQFQSTQTDDVPEMQHLREWLLAHLPPAGRTAIVHGDYRLNNVLLHPTEPRVVAILDWELSTLGDPLCDLAYTCFCYHVDEPPVGFGGADPAALGIASEEAFIRRYCAAAGLDPAGFDRRHWKFYLALQLYKSAAILQGVVRRALQGAGPPAWLAKQPLVTARARLGLAMAG